MGFLWLTQKISNKISILTYNLLFYIKYNMAGAGKKLKEEVHFQANWILAFIDRPFSEQLVNCKQTIGKSYQNRKLAVSNWIVDEITNFNYCAAIWYDPVVAFFFVPLLRYKFGVSAGGWCRWACSVAPNKKNSEICMLPPVVILAGKSESRRKRRNHGIGPSKSGISRSLASAHLSPMIITNDDDNAAAIFQNTNKVKDCARERVGENNGTESVASIFIALQTHTRARSLACSQEGNFLCIFGARRIMRSDRSARRV